jgi:ankyrin repeat protein
MSQSLLVCLFTTALIAADPAEVSKRIRDNDLTWLKIEAKDGALNNLKDARKNTPLIWASTLGSVEAIEILLATGANPNEANAFGITPLIAAATEPAKVKALLAKGADVKAKTQMGQHALAVAAASPRATESVKLLLAAGASPNERGAQGGTPLLSALGNACAEQNARLLLAAGADAKALDGAGFGAAQSVISCPIGLIKDLLRLGANVNQQNTFGGKVKFGDIQLKGISPLMLASAHRDPAIVQTLLDAGADVNAKDIRGMTPLLYAVSSEEQNTANIKLLLAKGADPKAKDANGEDAITWAKKFNNPAVLALLGDKPQPFQPLNSFISKGPGPQAALAKLESSNEEFFRQSGCGGCHHSTLLSVAAAHAKKAGLAVNPGLVEARSQRTKGMLGAFSTALQQLVPLPGDIDTALYTLLEAQSLGLASSPEFETLARYIWAKQNSEGSWGMRGISRSPIEESDIHRTALAIGLLPAYSDATMRAAATTRLQKSTQWLQSQKARNTDELAMKLLGLKWGNASAASINKAARELATAQLSDGSWAGNRNLTGDPYSTGFALFALREGAAWKADAKPIASAAKWLRATQKEDGTWYQKSRAPKFQPYFESGFPYGHDQWISAGATAWAIVGLTEAGSL